jgi:pimeloyl-ACP methyl ester carboxylesterase
MIALCCALAVSAVMAVAPAHAQGKTAVQSRFANVNGIRIHYLVAGKGDPIILLHGYAQNSHMWRPAIPELAKANMVVAPDLRGFGQSDKPPQGYDKVTMPRISVLSRYHSD